MADVDTLKSAPKATVVEAAAPLSSMPMWSLHYYEHGKPVGGSIARGDQVREWLDDLQRAGYLIGFGWQIRGDAAPDDWPGWPIDAEKNSAPVYPAPGSEIPGQPGFVVGTCGHLVAGSEWRAEFRTCERCPDEQDDEPEPCGENSCICYCIGDCHPCGCDCPREDGGAER